MGAYETPNTPPQADAGGPYNGDEGIALDGSVSSDIDTDDVLFYEWDCTADGDYDTSSYTATDSLCTYPQDGDYTLRLRVTDSLSATDIATATVTITVTAVNDPPVADDDAFTVYEDAAADDHPGHVIAIQELRCGHLLADQADGQVLHHVRH